MEFINCKENEMKQKDIGNIETFRSQYLCEKEKEFKEFCEKNEINFHVKSENLGRGVNHYSVSFVPDYIDNIEIKMHKALIDSKINYKFAVGENTTHHYEFDRLIEFKDDYEVNHNYQHKIPIIKRDLEKEFEYVDNDEEINSIKREVNILNNEIISLNSEIKKLSNKTYFQKIIENIYYLFYPRENILENKIQRANELTKLFTKKQNNLKILKQKKQNNLEMLIMAGVFPDKIES